MRQLAYRGVTVEEGPYYLQSVDGLEGAGVRSGDQEQPRGDGELPGAHYLQARSPVFSLLSHQSDLPALLSAFTPQRRLESPLTWLDDAGMARLMYARVIDLADDRSVSLPRWVAVTIAMKASDPRIYGDRRLVGLQPFAVAGGGLDYPVNYPKDYGADELVESVAHNAGDSDAHPTIRVHGPEVGSLTSWRLTNTTNGSQVQVDAAVGPGQLLTVRMREWIVADPNVLVVELDGASRYGDWVTRPEVLWLSPGDNVLRFEILAGDAPSSAEIVYRSTFGGTRRENVE